MEHTKPHGALSPGLAVVLDRVADTGRKDRLLTQLGYPPADRAGPAGDDQLALLTVSEDGSTLVSYEGVEL